MSYINPCAELDEQGGRLRQTHYLRPVAYDSGGGRLAAIASDWADGDQDFPHLVSRAPMQVGVGAGGKRRIYPLPGDLNRYVEFDAPYIKPAGSWQQVSLGQAARSGNRLAWTTPNANVYIDMAGHFVKLGVLLKNGWRPPNNQFAFPVSLTGLTRQGGQLLADGAPVLNLTAPVVYDLDNELDRRPIDFQFGAIGGQTGVLFTLPDLSGMSRPLVDPTLALQPDATAGIDSMLVSLNATTNYGSNGTFYIGQNNVDSNVIRAIIKFDLSTLPAAAIISSATLSIYAINDYSSNARTFRVFRQKRAWVESQVTWNIYSTGNNWQTAGGFGANDCEQTDIGSRDMLANETTSQFKDWSLTPTTKSGLDLGNGWLIKADTETFDQYECASSDNATSANRPKLTIVYSLPTGLLLRGVS